jgi:ABC-type sugar transport system substrate-binding protein
MTSRALTSVDAYQTADGSSSSYSSGHRNYTFVLIPKSADNSFFVEVFSGFKAAADGLDLANVNTVFFGPDVAEARRQADLIYSLVENPEDFNITQVDGIAVSVLDEAILGEAIDFATERNIPVVTFDSDAPNSKRRAFVSTNSSAFGEELGKVMNQLDPEGGRYRMITGLGPNLQLRVNGVRDALRETKWVEVQPPLDCMENITLALEQMIAIASDPQTIRGIIPVGGWPMYDAQAFQEFAKTYNYNTTYVVGDANRIQLDLMNQGHVDGLVGQLPQAIGSLSFQVLLNITEGQTLSKDYYGTHFLEVLRVPLQLPPVQMNYNYLGNVDILGYTLFSVVVVLSLSFLSWVVMHRKARIVRASQPFFMAMLCFGSLIMGSAMIPLGIEDEHFSQKSTDIACMSIPWLLVIGFCITFSALFTKTWRILIILESAQRFKRVKITVKQVLYPFFSLLLVNVIILTCWTAINPLVFKRKNSTSRDGWNRVISTYGVCVSKHQESRGSSAPYLGCLAFVNGGILLLANVMAYRSRNMCTEFNESHYIAIVMASMLQAFLIGIPLIFLVLDQPQPFYVIIVILDFAVCMTTLMFMFIPKILAHREYLTLKKERNCVEGSTPATEGLKLFRQELNRQSFSGSGSNFNVSAGSTTLQLTKRNYPLRSTSLPADFPIKTSHTLSLAGNKDTTKEVGVMAAEPTEIACQHPRQNTCLLKSISWNEKSKLNKPFNKALDHIISVIEGLPESEKKAVIDSLLLRLSVSSDTTNSGEALPKTPE